MMRLPLVWETASFWETSPMSCRLPLLLAFLSLATCARAAEPAAAPAADKWEKAIAAFEAEDQASPPPASAVLFVGSSSIRLWDLKKSFPDLPAINRGFGGSQMADAVKHASRIVTPYKPRAIVLYEGDNDLNAKKSPAQVAADFDAFLKVVRAELPTTPVLAIGCKPSPARWKLIEQQRELNRLLAERCQQDGHATFIDIERPMLNADGQPRAELFREDKLHMNDAGYEVWTTLLQPLLNK
jgi:lysophospholipase L1-like esterase